MRFLTSLFLLFSLSCFSKPAAPAAGEFAALAGFAYSVKTDLSYATASNLELKLDLYQPRGLARGQKVPVLVYFHGGGWVEGRRQGASLLLTPYLAQGWAVVNVDYRLARVAPAPAAVEDARCALHWVVRMADEYGFDRDAIVLAGDSAGGHLALLAAMLPTDSPFDRACPAPDAVRWIGQPRPQAKVAAVVNWFGVSDVAAMLGGPTRRNFAVEWFGAVAGREQLAAQLSPLGWVRPGVPPVITVHGDADPVVPHAQALALHAALDRAGVPNRLVTVAGGRHGDFRRDQVLDAVEQVLRFLKSRGVEGRALMP